MHIRELIECCGIFAVIINPTHLRSHPCCIEMSSLCVIIAHVTANCSSGKGFTSFTLCPFLSQPLFTWAASVWSVSLTEHQRVTLVEEMFVRVHFLSNNTTGCLGLLEAIMVIMVKTVFVDPHTLFVHTHVQVCILLVDESVCELLVCLCAWE